jgi:hypothetical protein
LLEQRQRFEQLDSSSAPSGAAISKPTTEATASSSSTATSAFVPRTRTIIRPRAHASNHGGVRAPITGNVSPAAPAADGTAAVTVAAEPPPPGPPLFPRGGSLLLPSHRSKALSLSFTPAEAHAAVAVAQTVQTPPPPPSQL